MANQTSETTTPDYDDMTVIELKDEAKKRNVELEPDLRKDEIIKALEKDDKKPSGKASSAKASDAGDVKGHLTIKGSEKSDTRLFQTSPYVKEWLTQGEAESKGFYWRDTEKLGPA